MPRMGLSCHGCLRHDRTFQNFLWGGGGGGKNPCCTTLCLSLGIAYYFAMVGLESSCEPTGSFCFGLDALGISKKLWTIQSKLPFSIFFFKLLLLVYTEIPNFIASTVQFLQRKKKKNNEGIDNVYNNIAKLFVYYTLHDISGCI